MKNFNIMGVTRKIRLFGTQKAIYRGNFLKRGLGQFADLRGGLAEKSGGHVFEREDTQCTLWYSVKWLLDCFFCSIGWLVFDSMGLFSVDA